MSDNAPPSGYDLLVLSGPSGSGKTTLVRRLLMAVPGLRFTVSHTTRERRPGETPGEDYHFVSRGDFEAKVQTGEFLEWAEVHGQLYGTGWAELVPSKGRAKTLILDVDVQGAAAVRHRLPGSMSVFVMPPSLPALRSRLMQRESLWTAAMEKRLQTARQEMKHCEQFDFIVINDVLDDALSNLIHIVHAVAQRTPRQMDRVKRIRGE